VQVAVVNILSHGPARAAEVAARVRRLSSTTTAVLLTALTAGGIVDHEGIACNRTESVPIGFYRTAPIDEQRLARGTLVSIDAPPAVASLVRERDYLRPGERFFKRILAVPGDHVCVDGERFVVNDVTIGPVFKADRRGRPLPSQSACGRVPADTYWVGSSYERSFDSRYFGPVSKSDLRQRLEPLWTF
jgi:conjugative transfer signal peptidase TraF